MTFASFAEFFAMGHHGLYVWSAYALCSLVLIANVVDPLQARRRYLEEQARRLRREKNY